MPSIANMNTVELTEALVSKETQFNELKEQEDPNSAKLTKVGRELDILEEEAARRNNVNSSVTNTGM